MTAVVPSQATGREPADRPGPAELPDSPPGALWVGPLPAPPGEPPGRRPRAGMLVAGTDLAALALPALVLDAPLLPALVLAAICLALFDAAGLYRSRLHLSALDDLPALVGRALGASAALVVAVELLVGTTRVTVHAALLAAAAVLPARAVAYAVVRHARRTGRASHRTVLVGAGEVTAQLSVTLAAHPELGLRPVGTVDDDPLLPGATAWLGPVSRLPVVLTEQRAAVVLVSFGRFSEPDLVAVLRACERARCEVLVVPRLFEVHDRDAVDHIGAVPVLRLRRHRLRRATWPLKRALDVAVSGTALLLLLPVLLVLAAAVRLEGGPGVLFRQQRIGLDGRPFQLLKLRSMRPLDDLEADTRWNVALDARLGPVGRFLRRSSFDELPQLWNVLRGDMSLVGPRPERPHFVDLFSVELPRYQHRHRVPSGLTGLAQVNGLRGDTPVIDRARFDNYYIEHWSLWLDVKILLRTVREVLLARGR